MQNPRQETTCCLREDCPLLEFEKAHGRSQLKRKDADEVYRSPATLSSLEPFLKDASHTEARDREEFDRMAEERRQKVSRDRLIMQKITGSDRVFQVLLDLRDGLLTYQDIAGVVGCHRATVRRHEKEHHCHMREHWPSGGKSKP